MSFRPYEPHIPDNLLEALTDEGFDAYNQDFGNFAIKVGVAVKRYDVEDEENQRKLGPEYDVVCIEQNADGGLNSYTYRKAITLDVFGGISDFAEWTRRTPTEEDYKKNLDGEKQDGSFVLLLCIDGNAENSIILGGVRHPGRKEEKLKKNEHHFESEFNGMNFKINNDGELTITFKSASDNKGKYADEEAGGTHIQMDKTGQVDINTNLEGDDETYIRMDKANKDVGLKAGQHIGFTAKGNIAQIADGDVKATAKGNWVQMAEGTANVDVKGAFTLKSGGPMQMDFPDLQIMAGNGIIAQASQMIFDSPLIQLGNGGAPAITLSTQFLGTGNLGAPVVSTAIGPFSAVVFIA
jgi:hypothetical protein